MQSVFRAVFLFSLLAVVLFFGSVWFVIEYQGLIFGWIKANMVVHGSVVAVTVMVEDPSPTSVITRVAPETFTVTTFTLLLTAL